MTLAPAAEPRRRLHPLSPLLKGGRLAVLAIIAISWQGYSNLGTQRWLLAIAGVAVLTIIGSVVSYLVTGYHVVGRELRIYEGLIVRRTRAIPVERLQSVELVRPVLARVFGLAELRLEVVGGSSTEAPLAFLDVDDAQALRKRLLALRAPAASAATAAALTDAGETAQPPPADLAERPVHVVDNRDLVVSQLVRPRWLALPLAIAAPIIYFAFEFQLTFIAIASTLTAVVGAIQAPVRVLLSDWRFTLGQAPDGLRIRRGLLETRSQTVPPGRIQSVGVEWPLLWRGFGWVRVSMNVAGLTGREQGEERAGLLPVGTVDTAERVLAEALPGFVLRSVAVAAVPRRAAWLVPLRRYVLGYQLAATAFVTRDGLLTRRITVVPYGRIQSVRIRQGPLERLLRLASVWADTAGGGTTAVALHVDRADARTLAIALAERSRSARLASPAAIDRSAGTADAISSAEAPRGTADAISSAEAPRGTADAISSAEAPRSQEDSPA